ncbi:hypothetical protein AB0F91_43160 [Amycolatopsis sp. NPDC023774]
MTATRIQFVTVPVAEKAKTRDFHVEKLGFEVVAERATARPAGS